MIRNVSFLSLCFLIFILLSFISLVHGEEVTFPDPNLEAAIREALNKPEGPITDEDLAGLTELDASERGIIDLTGIEYCINLQGLSLHSNQISNLNPLSGLTNLQWLHLMDNWIIEDISPLSSLTNLQMLHLGGNSINDTGPLSGLINLQELHLDHNQISDLNPLSGLTNLQLLNLQNNQIINLNPLSGLINLRSLELWSNQIIDLSPLSGLTNLQGLRLDDNQISDIGPLSNLTNLQCLDLNHNQISDFSPLSNLINLQCLALGGNQISDLSPLSNLTNLQELNLWGNQIIDISPLSGLTNLQMFHVANNQISDINPLGNLTGLRLLYLDNNQIQDISPLAGLTKIGEWEGWSETRDGVMVHLGLSNNQISDITPLLNNPGIGEGDGIDLRGNQIDVQKLQEKGAAIILFDTPPFWRELHKPLAEEGYITEGLILDPLEDTAYNEWDIGIDFLQSAGGEAKVTPREGDVLIFHEKEHRWKAYTFDVGNVFNWIFGEGANDTTYVVTYLKFEEKGEVDVWVGSDDDVSIWMNDQNVWVNPVLRGWAPDQDKFTAQVRSGWNRLLVKVNNRGGGGWGFSVRFPNAKPVEVSLNPDVMRLIGDVSGNGAITAYDAALILQFTVGLIDHLPAPTDVQVSSSPHPFKLRIPQVKAHLQDEIRLPILVDDASGLFAGGLILRYDPRVLKAEDVLAGALSSGTYWKAGVEEEGILRIAFANEGEMKGSGTLFEVKMKSIGEGESEIKVERADLFMDWGVKVEEGLVRVIPNETILLQNYPNPFNPETWIPFKLAEGSEVVIRLYDMAGRLVRKIDLGYMNAGNYTTRGRAVRWDGRNELGERVANGAYIYQLQAGDRMFVKRMVVLK